MSDILNASLVEFAANEPVVQNLLYDLDLLPEQLLSQYASGNITDGLREAISKFHLIVDHFKWFATKHPCAGSPYPIAGWQSIATAPRDGRLILGFAIFDSATGNWRIRIMSYDAVSPTKTGTRWDGWGSTWTLPTHWMPLPEPPEDNSVSSALRLEASE